MGRGNEHYLQNLKPTYIWTSDIDPHALGTQCVVHGPVELASAESFVDFQSQAPPQTYWNANCIWIRPLGKFVCLRRWNIEPAHPWAQWSEFWVSPSAHHPPAWAPSIQLGRTMLNAKFHLYNKIVYFLITTENFRELTESCVEFYEAPLFLWIKCA